jgi:VWFA-related protein
MRTRWLACGSCLAAALLASSSTRLAARQPAAAPVLVDFRAVSEDGRPIEDLTPADVTLRVGGRARAVKSLEFIRIAADAPGAPATPALPPPFATNVRASGPAGPRDVLIVIDELSIAPGKEPPIRESLSRLLDSLTPADRAGVLSTRQGGPARAFTGDRELVRAAIGRFSGFAPVRLSESDFQCNAVLVLNTLKGAFGQFSPSGVPTLVFVSAAVAGPASDRMATIGKESELCPLRPNHFEEIGAAAYDSRANVYVVHALEAASPSQGPTASQAGIDAIAGVTGAETLRITGGTTDTSLTRIARETSGYYLAAFDAEQADRSGTRQRLDVRVGRQGVRVSARPTIVIPKAGAATGPTPAPRDMIRVPTTFTDLPLRGGVYPSRNPQGQVRLVVLFEPADPAARLAAASVVAFDAKGTGRPWHAEGNDLARFPVRAAIDVQPGVYRVRIAAADQSGRGGTIDVDAHAQLAEAGPLKLSALVLGIAADGAFSPRLQFDAGDPQAIGYLEVYGVPKGANLGVTFELAETAGGPAIATGAAQVGAGSAEDARLAFGGFGIAPMQPGDVEMRAVVTLDGARAGAVSRTLRKK